MVKGAELRDRRLIEQSKLLPNYFATTWSDPEPDCSCSNECMQQPQCNKPFLMDKWIFKSVLVHLCSTVQIIQVLWYIHAYYEVSMLKNVQVLYNDLLISVKETICTLNFSQINSRNTYFILCLNTYKAALQNPSPKSLQHEYDKRWIR